MARRIPLSFPIPRELRFQVALFSAARFVTDTLFRMVYPFLPVLAQGLGVSVSSITLAITGRSLTGALGPFLASVADSRGRKAGMLSGLGIYVLGAGLVVFWPVYPAFFAALTLCGLGTLVFIPSMQAYVGDRVPYQQRGFALALTEVSWSLSFILGVPLAGFLIARYGWLAPFPLLALLGVIVLLLLAWKLPPDPAPTEGQPNLWRNLHAVLASPTARAALTFSILVACANEVVNLVFGLWIEGSFHLQIAALGAASALIGVSELGGEFSSGALVDRLGKKRAVAAGLLLNALAALSLPLLGRTLPGALAGLFLFYISFEFTIVSSLPLMTQVLPSARATLMASNVAALSLGRAFGALLATPLFAAGILAPALASLLFNLLALLALRKVRGVE